MKELDIRRFSLSYPFDPSSSIHFLRAIPPPSCLSPVDVLEYSRAYGLLTEEHLNIYRATTLLNLHRLLFPIVLLICFSTLPPASAVCDGSSLH